MPKFDIELWHISRELELTEEGFVVSTVSHCSILKQDIADVNNVTLSDWNGARFKMKSFSFLDRSKGFRLENGLQFGPRGTNTKSKSESLRLVGRGNLDTQ